MRRIVNPSIYKRQIAAISKRSRSVTENSICEDSHWKSFGLLKNRYTISQGILPLRLLKSIKDEGVSATFANCDKIFTVRAALTNLGDSILYNE